MTDPDDPNNLPLTSEEKAEVKYRFLAASKRPAAEFFELYQEVVEKKVFDYAQGRVDSETIMESLRARRSVYTRVKREFVAMSLGYSESFKVIGMVVDARGNASAPSGDIRIQLLDRKESVKFSGEAAVVALNYFMWWHSMKQAINPIEAGKLTAESLLDGPSGHASNVLQFPKRPAQAQKAPAPEPKIQETVLGLDGTGVGKP